jgi:cna B domain protein
LSGIEFKLIAKEDIIDNADGSKIYSKGQEIGTYNLNKNGNLKVENLPMGTYELEETKTLDGLVLNDTKYEIKFEQEDLIRKVYEDKENISNDTTIFEFSKKSITGDDELEGAKLSVTDENGKIIDTWTSSKDNHKIEGLIVGKTYKSNEEIAPDGYTKATSVEFKVENTKEIQKVEMIDKIVTMSKKDIGGNEVDGAKIKVFDKDGSVIDEWVSGKENHNIKGLTEGEKYILHEEYAPDEFAIATDVEFEVTYGKETQEIVLIDKSVEITKTDLVTGDEIEGAELQVVDENGNIIDEWVSEKEPHKVTGLEENKKHELIEKTAPYGYETTEKIEFVVTTDKETQKIEMKDMPILKNIKLNKIDSKTKELIKEKFVFGIYEDEECNNLIKEVKSNKNDGYVVFDQLRYGKYYIKEIKAPVGYELSNKIVNIEINDNGVFADGNLIEENDSIYSIDFENDIIEVPNTGDNRHTEIFALIGGLSAISLAGAFIYDYKKKSRKKKNK